MAEAQQVINPTSLPLSQAVQETEHGSHGNTPPPRSSPEVPTLANQFRLTCPLCLEDLKRPKQLADCFHIFCADCLKGIIGRDSVGRNTVTCPTCQKTSACPTDLSTWLETDAYLHAFQGVLSVYAESGSVTCSDTAHDQVTPASVFCLECSKNFCSECNTNHKGNEALRNHHTLHLFKSPVTMTVGRGRREILTAARDETDEGADNYQCPICRNTAPCEHLKILDDLWEDEFRKQNDCPIPSHAEGPRLIAYCKECSEPVCRNCSAIEHKHHHTINIEAAKEEKLRLIEPMRVVLDSRTQMFQEAKESAREAERAFEYHIHEIQKAMAERKGRMQIEVEKAFTTACNVIEETGQKVAELNRQISEMQAEENFLRAAVRLAELASMRETSGVEIVRIWKGIQKLHEDMGGETDKKHAKIVDDVIPQDIKEKRLVLPAPNCMAPDLSILEKVGVEGKVLELSFMLPAEKELLGFYSILPITPTEALLVCKPEACKSAVVGYDNLRKQYSSVVLKGKGQYCLAKVPGNGIVATHYQVPGACSQQAKKEVLFWDQALGCSLAELEKRGAGKLTQIVQTELPPRCVAVTRENNLVICTADDPVGGAARRSSILLMTLKGDILYEKPSPVPMGGGSGDDRYFPRYATVNINNDICITDAENRSVLILNSQLREKLRLHNPYQNEGQNSQFMPMGICHDSFGRLIVADPMNNAVLRYEVNETEANVQIILQHPYGHAKGMWGPTLVALGPGPEPGICPKLWVVCSSKIFVFDYMDKE